MNRSSVVRKRIRSRASRAMDEAFRRRFRRDAVMALLFSVVVASLCVYLFWRLTPERFFRDGGSSCRLANAPEDAR